MITDVAPSLSVSTCMETFPSNLGIQWPYRDCLSIHVVSMVVWGLPTLHIYTIRLAMSILCPSLDGPQVCNLYTYTCMSSEKSWCILCPSRDCPRVAYVHTHTSIHVDSCVSEMPIPQCHTCKCKFVHCMSGLSQCTAMTGAAYVHLRTTPGCVLQAA